MTKDGALTYLETINKIPMNGEMGMLLRQRASEAVNVVLRNPSNKAAIDYMWKLINIIESIAQSAKDISKKTVYDTDKY